MARNRFLGLTRLGFAVGLLFALLLAPTPARAQDDVTLTMARERFKEGVAFFDQKQFAKARVAFLQAYALKKHPAVLLNLAQSELRSGHEADAAKHFAQYLREHKEATDAEKQGAQTGLTAAKALVAEVKLDVDAPEAEVYIDGELEGRAPLPGSIFLAPGTHALEARKDGKTATTEVRASAGLETTASLSLNQAAAAPPSPTASGEQPHESELEPSQAPSSGGRMSYFKWQTSRAPAIVGGLIAVVGATGGIAFALGSKSSYDAADSVAQKIEATAVADGKTDGSGMPSGAGACVEPNTWLSATPSYGGAANTAKREERVNEYIENCSKYPDNVDSGDQLKTLATVSFIVAGAAAVGTIVYYFIDPHAKESAGNKAAPKLAIAPLYEPGLAGAVLFGTF